MSKIKTFMIFILTLSFVFIINTQVVQADLGPKPSTSVEIKGLEETESYTVTFLGKEPPPPYDHDYSYLDPNPIMDFVEGDYKFVGYYWVKEGNSKVTWGYYPPSPFKVLILMEDGSYFISNELEQFAFESSFIMDLSNTESGAAGTVTLVENVTAIYQTNQEITNFFIRLGITIAIELVVAVLFFYRKRLLLYTIVVNIITQILLNVGLNFFYQYTGAWGGMFLFIVMEIIVLIVELILYTKLLKEKGTTRAILYTFVANGITFIVSFSSLLDMIQK